VGFLSGLALVLLTLVGYSSGAVIGARGKSVAPKLLDLGAVAVLLIAALTSRTVLGRWVAIGVWLVIGGLVSLVLSRVRRGEISAKTEKTVSAQEGNPFTRLWEGWKSFAADMGDYQSRILLASFYFVVVTPFGLLVRLLSDPLRTKYPAVDSFWASRSEISAELDEAKRQF
jgi:uncharacterized membrane protein YebE (DUF533 family)